MLSDELRFAPEEVELPSEWPLTGIVGNGTGGEVANWLAVDVFAVVPNVALLKSKNVPVGFTGATTVPELEL